MRRAFIISDGKFGNHKRGVPQLLIGNRQLQGHALLLLYSPKRACVDVSPNGAVKP